MKGLPPAGPVAATGAELPPPPPPRPLATALPMSEEALFENPYSRVGPSPR